ncbi:hypothetical protein PGQ11_012879 [Apiospora arundinis]|uniref:Uncharacterized protein n=1 Tax=Apiospora arundinis TaxID=335852 RepID=A0ABR2I4L3_9PEZI
MIYRSTLARLVTARAVAARQSRSPLLPPALRQSRRLHVSNRPTQKSTAARLADDPDEEGPTLHDQQGAKVRTALSRLSSDRADLQATLQLKHLSEKAWAEDGRHALDLLDRLCLETHGDLAITKAVICLEAYKHRFGRLSVKDARTILASDDAANRVVQWFETKGVIQHLRDRHPDYKKLLALISDILIGAGRLQHKTRVLAIGAMVSSYYIAQQMLGRWRPPLERQSIRSDVWVTRMSHKYVFHTVFGYVQARVSMLRILRNSGRLCLNPGLFDRCITALERLTLEEDELDPRGLLRLASIKLHHPLDPNPYPFLWFMRDVDSDPLHARRTFASKEQKHALGDFYYAKTKLTQDLLNRRGRVDDGKWLFRAFQKHFGRDSGTFNLSRERRSRGEIFQWELGWKAKHFPNYEPIRRELVSFRAKRLRGIPDQTTRTSPRRNVTLFFDNQRLRWIVGPRNDM